jgi:hypothetical protein
MADYVYLEYEQLSLVDRFPESGTIGVADWRTYTRYLIGLLAETETDSYDTSIRPGIMKQLEDLSGAGPSEAFPSRPTAELVLLLLLARLRLPGTIVQRGRRCPRLFVSHRQPDVLYALRVAYLAGRNGFDYWVDTLPLYLGATTKTEAEIEAWLRSEVPVPALPDCGGTSHPVVAPVELDQIDEAEKRKFEAWLDAGMPLEEDVNTLPLIRFK